MQSGGGKKRDRNIKWKGKNSATSVRFTDIGNGAPRNSALPTERAEMFSEENESNFAEREVFISIAVLGCGEINRGAGSNSVDCSCIVGSDFNGGALCSFSWSRRYKTYSMSIYPKMPK